MIRFWCSCGRRLQAAESFIGQIAACPVCSQTTIIPPSDQPQPLRGGVSVNQYGEIERGPAVAKRADPPPRRAPVGKSMAASAALVFGVLSFPFCLGLFTGLPAILFGVLALCNPHVRSGATRGRGKAVAGIVLGALGMALMGYFFWLGQDSGARASEKNQLFQLGLAMQTHHDANGRLPAATSFRTKDDKPGLSWRVALLPYLGQDNLYRQFKLDEPWDSPHNKRLLTQMPKVYAQPGDDATTGLTLYQGFVGPGAAFEDEKGAGVIAGAPQMGLRLTDFADGTSNTILIAVAQTPVPWTKPDDLPFDPNKPPPRLDQRFGGHHVTMADGSVRTIPTTTPPLTLRSMVTRNGGEVVAWP